MPTYLYQVVHGDGSLGALIEINHAAAQPPLTAHPTTGQTLVKHFTTPYISAKHTPGRTRALLSNDNLKQNGFSKYQKNPSSGQYEKLI